MTEEQIFDFADRFTAAISSGDSTAVRPLYAVDARIWHNTDGVAQTVDQAMNTVEWLGRKIPDQTCRIVRRALLKDGYLQQEVLEATLPDGAPFRLNACMIVQLRDGLVARVDEYLDSAELQPLLAFGR